MRYKVKFNVDGYITYYTKKTEDCDFDLSLWIEKDGNVVRDVIISDNKPKVFEALFILICCISGSDDDYASGQGELDRTEFCLTIQDGQLDLTVKPMAGMYSYMYWDSYEEEGNFPDGEQLLTDKVVRLLDSSDFGDTLTSSRIKQCLLKHITVEKIED